MCISMNNTLEISISICCAVTKILHASQVRNVAFVLHDRRNVGLDSRRKISVVLQLLPPAPGQQMLPIRVISRCLQLHARSSAKAERRVKLSRRSVRAADRQRHGSNPIDNKDNDYPKPNPLHIFTRRCDGTIVAWSWMVMQRCFYNRG